MNKTYVIRDKEGVMIAKISNELFARILSEGCGFWRSYKTASKKTVCYEIMHDMKYESSSISLYLWIGNIVVEE